MRLRIYTIIGAGLLATCGQVCAQEPKLPFISAPLVTMAPTVDGKINTSEWAGASAISGLLRVGSDKFSGENTVFWTCHDASALYLAWRRYQTRIPKADISARDGALWSDDSAEIFFQPHKGMAPYYQFIGNAAGVFWDSEGVAPQWNGQWTYATSVTTSYWEAELRVPWTTLYTETPAVGTVMGFNFCTDIQSQPPQSETWAPLGNASFHDATRFGSLIIGGSTPAVVLPAPADLGSSKVGAVVDVYNQSAEKRVLRTVTQMLRGGKVMEKKSQDYDLAPDAVKTIIDLKTRESGDYDCTVSVFDVTNGQKIPLSGRTVAVSLSQPPVVKLGPSGKWLEVTVITQGMSKLQDARLYAVLTNTDRDIVGQIISLNPKMKTAKARLNLMRVKPGRYTLAIVVAGGTQRLMEYQQVVVKK